MNLTKRTRKGRIIVSGMIGGDPGQGGATLAVLQYVLGLKQLGYDVCLIEPIVPGSIRPAGAPLHFSENAEYFQQIARDFDLAGECSLVLDGTKETVGLSYTELHRISASADVLLNISGMLRREELIARIPARVYLDLDPAFNQLWHATQGIDMRFSAHNLFVTVGKAIGQPSCSIPTCGVPWIGTFQPVLLNFFREDRGIQYNAFTTVANWRAYGSIEYGGMLYGQKAHSLRSFIEIPTRTCEELVLALSIHPEERKDLESLARNGWKLVDPAVVACTPMRYLDFIRGSKAEFGIAKSGYVAARCGWFSDRSVCYLASGRPVVAQETGFSDYLPCGAGLFSFRCCDEALEAIHRVNADYACHSRAAQAIVYEYFDSNKVLSKLMASVH